MAGVSTNDIRVSTWTELQERLYEESWQPALGRFRSTHVYRGMPIASFDLTTTLMRLGGPFEELEGHLLRSFRKYAGRYQVPADSIWNWLALAQHHLLPTRLLDWTYSPYVALHFVTADLDCYAEDGVVWCVDYVKTNRSLPAALCRILEQEDTDVFTAEMLGEGAGSLAEFDALSDREFVVFFEPPSIDERIVNQFALFSLMSSPSARLDEWLARNPECYRRLIIPAPLKWEVRDKLDQANVSERVLFPGLDGLSAWLTRYYHPRRE